MDFNLPEDVATLVETTRGIARDLLGQEAELDRSGKVPEAVYAVLRGTGFSEGNGGMGAGLLALVCLQVELAHLPPQF